MQILRNRIAQVRLALRIAELKQKLMLQYGDNRQEYMLAKTEFVEKYTRLAEEGGIL